MNTQTTIERPKFFDYHHRGCPSNQGRPCECGRDELLETFAQLRAEKEKYGKMVSKFIDFCERHGLGKWGSEYSTAVLEYAEQLATVNKMQSKQNEQLRAERDALVSENENRLKAIRYCMKVLEMGDDNRPLEARVRYIKSERDTQRFALEKLFQACAKLCLEDMNKLEAEIINAAAALKVGDA